MYSTDHSTANPHVSSTAQVNFDNNFSYDSYGGMSIRLKLKKKEIYIQKSQKYTCKIDTILAQYAFKHPYVSK